MSIHQDRLNEIKARRAAAYKGEAWYYSPINEDVCYLDNNMDEMAIADVRSQEAGEFIAHAPADIDALLDYIERLEVKLDSVYNAKPQTIAATVESTSAHWPPD